MPGYTVSTENAVDTTLVTTAETVIATLPGCSTSAPGKAIRLRGQAKITLGTSATAVTMRIREDSVSGTLVEEANPEQIGTAAGSTEDFDIAGDFAAGSDVYNKTFVLTAQQTGAAANGTSLYAYLSADCE